MDAYFQTAKRGDIEKILQYYGSEFFDNITKQEWMIALEKVYKKTGQLEHFVSVSWTVQKKIGTAGAETFFVLNYKNGYEKGIVNEKFTLQQGSDYQPFLIVGHTLDSALFLE